MAITRLVSKPTNAYGTTSGAKITPRATNLTTRKKGSTPSGQRIGVKVRGGRR